MSFLALVWFAQEVRCCSRQSVMLWRGYRRAAQHTRPHGLTTSTILASTHEYAFFFSYGRNIGKRNTFPAIQTPSAHCIVAVNEQFLLHGLDLEESGMPSSFGCWNSHRPLAKGLPYLMPGAFTTWRYSYASTCIRHGLSGWNFACLGFRSSTSNRRGRGSRHCSRLAGAEASSFPQRFGTGRESKRHRQDISSSHCIIQRLAFYHQKPLVALCIRAGGGNRAMSPCVAEGVGHGARRTTRSGVGFWLCLFSWCAQEHVQDWKHGVRARRPHLLQSTEVPGRMAVAGTDVASTFSGPAKTAQHWTTRRY